MNFCPGEILLANLWLNTTGLFDHMCLLILNFVETIFPSYLVQFLDLCFLVEFRDRGHANQNTTKIQVSLEFALGESDERSRRRRSMKGRVAEIQLLQSSNLLKCTLRSPYLRQPHLVL
jgi:hypothetical protein